MQPSALCSTSQPPTHDGPTQRARPVGATHALDMGSARGVYCPKVVSPPAAVRGHSRTGYLVGVGIQAGVGVQTSEIGLEFESGLEPHGVPVVDLVGGEAVVRKQR